MLESGRDGRLKQLAEVVCLLLRWEMYPIGPRSRRWLYQWIHSRVANSIAARPRQGTAPGDEFGLVQSDDGLRQGVIVGVSYPARRGFDLLRHECGGVEKVIRSLNHECKKQPDNKRIAEVSGYFRNNRHRMGYAEAKARPSRHHCCPINITRI